MNSILSHIEYAERVAAARTVRAGELLQMATSDSAIALCERAMSYHATQARDLAATISDIPTAPR